MSRKRGPKSRPNRNSTRKGSSGRSHPPSGIEDQPVIGMLREALRASPIHFGITVLYLLEIAQGADLQFEGPAGSFADTFAEFDVAETTNALHVVATTTGDELAAARFRKVLEHRRQPVHPVVRDFGLVEVVEALLIGEEFSDGEHLALMLRWPDGTEAAVLTMIKYGEDGDYIGDVLIDEAGHAATRQMLERAGGLHPTIESLPLEGAREILSEAAVGYFELPPAERPQSEAWPATSAFLHHLALGMPEPPELMPGMMPELPSEVSRNLTPEQMRELTREIMGEVTGEGGAAPHTPAMFGFENETIPVPDPPAEPAVLRLRVEVEETEPLVWRELDVRSDLSLAHLSDVVIAAIGWDNSHLHRFWPGGPEAQRGPYFITDFDELEGADGTHEAAVRLDQVLRSTGELLYYEYDFGDSWGHLITLESTRPVTDADPGAVCVGGDRRGPLEDVGGPWGHNKVVADITGPRGRAGLDRDLQDWVPEDYDPAEFDVARTNRTLALVSRTPEDLAASVTALAGGPVVLAEGLQSVLGRLSRDDHLEILALVEEALAAEPVEITEDLTRTALPHVYAVLEHPRDGGYTLTQAGYIKPAVVKELLSVIELDDLWAGSGFREGDVRPLHWLRLGLTDVGLLRKIKGRLEITTKGLQSLNDPTKLVQQITSRIDGSRDDFDREARALFLLHVAGGEDPREALESTTDLLSIAGWREAESWRDLSPYAVWRATDHTRSLLGLTFVSPLDSGDEPVSPLLRRIAKDAVIDIG